MAENQWRGFLRGGRNAIQVVVAATIVGLAGGAALAGGLTPRMSSATGSDSSSAAPLPPEALAAACRARNPYLVTPCYAKGDEWDEPAVVAYRDTSDNSDHHVLATHRQVGATYGAAYDAERRHLFMAAYHKRGTAFGPLGPGGIYRIDMATGDVLQWLTVPDAGPDRHDRRGGYWPDARAQNSVGVVGLGDIDLSEDGADLFVINLQVRQIFRFRTSDRGLVQRIPIGAADEAWYGDARPFALAVAADKLYHGVVNTAFRSGDDRAIEALVYESRYDGGEMREVARFSLAYDRGAALRFGGGAAISARWRAWINGYDSVAGFPGFGIYPQPMLSDIAFTNDGDMVLGLRDRFGDMTFFDPGGANPPGEGAGIPAGDILLGRRSGDRWTVDAAPEHFAEDAGPGLGARSAVHEETGFGGLGYIPASDLVVTTGLAPERINSGGAFWFEPGSGDNTAREEIYAWSADAPNFGKANGLGDVELMCPVEVPTPTPTATLTATATSIPTSTPTPTLTLTPTITPTPTPYRIYLPFAESGCIPKKRYIDVVLVLDRSTSMLRPVEEGGIAKNEAAIQAAAHFVGQLQLEPDYLDRHDQVSIVGFNDLAWTQMPLSNDRGAVLSALDELREVTAEGTRLDLAFIQGQDALDTPARMPDNKPVLILLTDGIPNRVPFPPGGRQEDTVLEAAARARRSGTHVFTIGLGKPTDIFPRMLMEASSNPYDYYYAPRPEDLLGIYERIAGRFYTCDLDEPPPPTPCLPEHVHADVALVLDMSTSMRRDTPSGSIKLNAAIEAAHLFASLMDFEPDGWHRRDQVAIVGFNDEAWVEIGLSSDRAAIHDAIDRLRGRVAEGTRLDLAIERGQSVFYEDRLLENDAVMIVLSDGLPNRVPTPEPSGTQEETVLAEAAKAKLTSTRIFTIGLGLPDDILRDLLERVASSSRDYFFAPDGEDLEDIYRQIAGRIEECKPVGDG